MYEYLERIESIGPTSEKEELIKTMLSKYPASEKFLRIAFNDLVYGLDKKAFYNAFEMYGGCTPDYSFPDASDWIESLALPSNSLPNTGLPEEVIKEIERLDNFAKDLLSLSGHLMLENLYDFFVDIPALERKWFSRALLKDLRMGVQVKTVNKVFKSLSKPQIEKFAMQLAAKIEDPYDEAEVKSILKFPMAGEIKYDGYRIQAEVYEDTEGNTQVQLMSRRGKDKTAAYPDIVQALQTKFEGQHVLLDGEIIANSFQKLSRLDDASERRYVVFDLLNDETLQYSYRYDNLLNMFLDDNEPLIQLAEHYNIGEYNEMLEFFEQANKRGEEGIMLKFFDRPYERGSRKHMYKVKKVYTADLLITGWESGEGKRAGKLGAIICRDKTGTVVVQVGSGFTDSQIEEMSKEPEKLIGQIAEIMYNEKTETGSLRFPRFKTLRDDKDGPDDLSILKLREVEEK